MQLKLVRDVFTEASTTGKLFKDGVFFCYTLEDTARPDWVKIPGKTCIPEGTYQVYNTYSPRFKRVLPLVDNVKNFTGIRLHTGNTPENTEGCILLGLIREENRVWRSLEAVESIIDHISQAPCTSLEITHYVPV